VPVVSGGLFANILSRKQFDILLTAAATNDKVNVLASPHILALDNKEAKIEIADEVPVATSISSRRQLRTIQTLRSSSNQQGPFSQ